MQIAHVHSLLPHLCSITIHHHSAASESHQLTASRLEVVLVQGAMEGQEREREETAVGTVAVAVQQFLPAQHSAATSPGPPLFVSQSVCQWPGYTR